ncbi:MAG: type IV secretion system DNA-binding domain-containing protein [Rickettsiales bacterium]|nr:type IV secretion system DNA-binding domain-containing protein [Rickettsiales bacterium]
MQHLVRGGQTTIHAIRMLKQVLKHLLKIGVGIVLFVSAYSLLTNFSLYEIKIYVLFVVSKVLHSFKLGEIEFSITNSFGDQNLYSAIDIAGNTGLHAIFDSVNDSVVLYFNKSIEYAAIAILLITILFFIRGVLLSKHKVIRGNQIVKRKKLVKLIKFNNFLEDLRSPLNIMRLFSRDFRQRRASVASIPYPLHAEKTHTLITGAVGTGKTVLLSNLINQVKISNDKAIIYDFMGVYTERFYDVSRGDVILNPLDGRSPNWSLVNECSKPSDFDSIAKAFIPDKHSGDPFWENAARTVFAESLKYLYEKKDFSNKGLQDIFFSEDDNIFNEIVKSSGILKKILPDDSEKTKGSILSVMTTYVKSLRYLTDQEEKFFSIRDWVRDDHQKGFLIISSKADQHETLKPLISAIIEIMTNNLLSLHQNRSRRLWVFLDEVASMNNIPSLEPSLAQARQFGGSFVLTTQVMAQLRSIYGRDKAEAISGSCRNRVIFATPDEETANWCSNSLGKVEVEEIKVGSSYGSHEMRDGVNLSTHTQIKNIVLPTQIMNLDNLQCYVRFAGNFPICECKISYEKYDNIASRFIEVVNNSVLPIPPAPKEDNVPIEDTNEPEDDFAFLEDETENESDDKLDISKLKLNENIDNQNFDNF